MPLYEHHVFVCENRRPEDDPRGCCAAKGGAEVRTALKLAAKEAGLGKRVRVNNAGPYWGNRTLDLSRAAAEKLGFQGEGVAKLKVRVIKAPEEAETKYVENRAYDPVPGDIVQYASLDDAQRGVAVVLAFKATTGSPFAPVTTANAFTFRISST